MKFNKNVFYIILVIPILLYAQQWSETVDIVSNKYFASTSPGYTRCIASSPNGVLHCVWYDLDNGTYDVFYARSENYGENWSSPRALYVIPQLQSVFPSIAVCDSYIQIVWIEIDMVVLKPDQTRGRLCYANSRDGGNNWTINVLNADPSCLYPTITINENIPATNIIWLESDAIKGIYRISPDMPWSSPQTIYYDREYTLSPASISADGTSRKVHIAVMRTLIENLSHRDIVYIRSRNQGQDWDAPNILFSSGDDYYFGQPSISAYNNIVQIVWNASLSAYEDYFIMNIGSHDGGDSWYENITILDSSTGEVMLLDPSISIDQANIVHVVWSRYVGDNNNYEIFYKRSLNAGALWQETIRISNSDFYSGYASVVCNTHQTAGSKWVEDNGIYVLWSDDWPDLDWRTIYFKRGWQIGADATSPNHGRHLVRVVNKWDLTTTFQGDKAIFRQSLDGNCAPQTPMIINPPVALENGKTPTNAVNSLNSSWVCYTDNQSQQLNCLIQRNSQSQTDYRQVTIFNADSIYTSSLLLATPVLGTPQNMGYVVYATKEDGITKIRFSAFDTLRNQPYYTTVIDMGDEEFTVSSPSIAVTPKDLIHIVWQRNYHGNNTSNTSSIYYKTTINGVTPDAIRQGIFPEWTDIQRVSTEPPQWHTEPASNPFVEAQGEKVFVVWRGPNDEGNSEYGDIWQRQGELRPGGLPRWHDPRNVSRTPPQESNYPTMSTGTAVVWQESIPDPPRYQIYGEIQGQIRNLSNNEYNCKYPHCNVVPTEPWYYYMWRLLTVWTQEKIPGIYQIEYGRYDFDRRWDNDIPPIAVECGEVEQSLYCIDRVGYLNFNNYSVDYGTELKYNIPYLNPEKYYLLEAICFSDTITREKFVFEDSATKTIQLYPENPETLRIVLRPEHYDNTELFLKIRKMVGEHAVVAKIRLFEFELFDEHGTGPQSLFAYDNYDIPTKLLSHLVYPNPVKNATTIRYQLPFTSRVNISIYDVQGRKIRTIINETYEPGIYEQIWDVRDDRGRKVRTGVYFYRIETDDYQAVNKVVLMR